MQVKKFIFTVLAIFFVDLSLSQEILAQAPPSGGPPMRADSIAVGFLPAIAYNSDFGLILGGILNRYDYKSPNPPFKNFISANLLISTKGLFNAQFMLDQTKSFNSDLRSNYSFFVTRNLAAFYFGRGNDLGIDLQDWQNTDRYFFRSFEYGVEYYGRYPLYRGSGIRRFDFAFTGFVNYQTPWGNGTDRQIMVDLPLGVDGGMMNGLGLGVYWENRDSEFVPTTGNTFYFLASYAPKVFASDFAMGSIETNFTQFFNFHFLLDVVVANRLSYEYVYGDVPYWGLARLGGEQSLRGFPVNRFLGNSSVLHNLELRTWLWESFDQIIRIGGQLFVDSGRILDNEGISKITQDWHVSYGFGGAMSLFTPDFFLRGDVGFSQEMRRIYISVGYAF